MDFDKDIGQGERLRIKVLRTLEEMKLVVRLQDEIWGYGRPEAAFPYPDRCLFEFAESGGLVAGAFIGERIIGFSAAWLGMDKSLHKGYLHSQLVGIIEHHRNLGVGYYLKLHQRDYARAMNLDLIKWTFDPLKTRNANLNIKKLGGVVRVYTPDYYGNLQSTFNKGLATDRFWVEWHINSARVTSRLDHYSPAVDVSRYPLVTKLATADNFTTLAGYNLDIADSEILVEMPDDFERILEGNMDVAKDWQRGIREIFLNYFKRQYFIDDVTMAKGAYGTRIFYKLNSRGLMEILDTPKRSSL